MIVAIDGPAGSGKSTIARMIAEGLGFTYVNSGNLYRLFTLAALRAGCLGKGDEAILEVARTAHIEFRQRRHFLDGEDVEDILHSPEVDAQVAQVSSIPPLREIVNVHVRAIAGEGDSVVEGRDITTVVFPDADYKFYLDASPEARARRRLAQGTSGDDLAAIAANISMRDSIDRAKSTGALRIAPDAVVVDSSDLTLREVYDKVYGQILRKG